MSEKINVAELADTASALYIAVRAKAEEDAMKEARDIVIKSCKLEFFGATVESAGIIAQDSVFPDQWKVMFPVKFKNDPIPYTFYVEQTEIDKCLEESRYSEGDLSAAFIIASANMLARKLTAEIINEIMMSGGFDQVRATSKSIEEIRKSGIIDLLGK